MKTEQTECSETSAYKIQMPGNYTEESVQHSEHSESLKSRMYRDYAKTVKQNLNSRLMVEGVHSPETWTAVSHSRRSHSHENLKSL